MAARSDMRTSDFDYDLPSELIAQTPIEPRDSSRLLVMHRDTGVLEHRQFPDLLEYLRPGDVMELEVEGLGRQRQEVVAAG